ncbi:hypothetical protein GE21DRAFT_5026 [Neurospora crassa]|uniref:Uncharacterized protein n=1 Tax=Neurospora crassa (strain ATCC 24698 / 74-OR23-1A / CBS 708.71 / DSM 1257 / FGSC 987) TaxID=367110 RepID=Q7S3K0_NEUCR|nr:hypothetical protein NCU08243 [Neurospora crassa OR74A]EAA30097.1 hypothetical protein NCU08243 [Neurospora crassa OR74A]KHE86500.1 hypothetical protein GE21DRAFT_5026 [Neurospora crassa]|eukprot:XP_959333.1 hypothetical protein NCU08243 [Neurospora crassa OR74A]
MGMLDSLVALFRVSWTPGGAARTCFILPTIVAFIFKVEGGDTGKQAARRGRLQEDCRRWGRPTGRVAARPLKKAQRRNRLQPQTTASPYRRPQQAVPQAIALPTIEEPRKAYRSTTSQTNRSQGHGQYAGIIPSSPVNYQNDANNRYVVNQSGMNQFGTNQSHHDPNANFAGATQWGSNSSYNPVNHHNDGNNQYDIDQYDINQFGMNQPYYGPNATYAANPQSGGNSSNGPMDHLNDTSNQYSVNTHFAANPQAESGSNSLYNPVSHQNDANNQNGGNQFGMNQPNYSPNATHAASPQTTSNSSYSPMNHLNDAPNQYNVNTNFAATPQSAAAQAVNNQIMNTQISDNQQIQNNYFHPPLEANDVFGGSNPNGILDTNNGLHGQVHGHDVQPPNSAVYGQGFVDITNADNVGAYMPPNAPLPLAGHNSYHQHSLAGEDHTAPHLQHSWPVPPARPPRFPIAPAGPRACKGRRQNGIHRPCARADGGLCEACFVDKRNNANLRKNGQGKGRKGKKGGGSGDDIPRGGPGGGPPKGNGGGGGSGPAPGAGAVGVVLSGIDQMAY